MASPVTPLVEDSKEIEKDESSLDATDSFLKSEQEYVEKGLRRGFDIFVDRLKIHEQQNDAILKSDEISEIFGTYEIIYNANSDLFDQLMKVRMNRKLELRDHLGQIMAKWLPYLKLYIDYIVKNKQCYQKLNNLRKSNKKFAKFLSINEACARRKIKSFLDEPATHLPLYLQHMAHIYTAWNKEDSQNAETAESRKNLMSAIASVREITQQISSRVKNQKARRLLGTLQRKLFGNKILLIASHRLVVHYGELFLLNNHNDLELCHFILCNDILVIAKSKVSANAKALYHVMPLIGLKIDRDATLPKNFNNKENLKQFGLKGIVSDAVKELMVLTETDDDRSDWMTIIEDTVDEEEHSLHPCNPVDLEKRLRKEKCSKEGMADTLKVSDPAVIKKIQEWKANGKQKPIGSKKNTMTNLSASKKPPPRKASPGAPGAPGGGGHGGPPPPRGHAKPPPSGGKGGAPPPRRGGGAAPPGRGGGKPPPKKALTGRAGMLAGIAKFDTSKGLKKVDTTQPDRRSSSKVSVKEEEEKDMGELLQNALTEYRQWVIPDEDDDDDEDTDWND